MKKISLLLMALWVFQSYAQVSINLDQTFGNSGHFSYQIPPNQIITQSKMILLSGNSLLQIIQTTETDYILKVKPNGTLDENFGTNGLLDLGVNNYVNALMQGKKLIVYFGPKSSGLNSYEDSKIVRYTENGIIDTSFGNNGVLEEITESINPQALSVLVLADQSLVVTNSTEVNPKKYTKNGVLDVSHGNNGQINYNYHYPIGQFQNGKIATCNINSLASSIFSFYHLNFPGANSVLDLNAKVCHQYNGVPLQNKSNISTKITKDGMVYSLFEYKNYSLPDFSRLIVLKSEDLDSNFNMQGFVTSDDNEQFLDAGYANNVFFILNQKSTQIAMNAYSSAGSPLIINNNRDYKLTGGKQIEVAGDFIYISSISAGSAQNLSQINIEKFIMLNEKLAVSNDLYEKPSVENPVKDILNFANTINAESFQIYSVEGKIVLTSKSFVGNNMSQLPKGNYLLTIRMKNGENLSKKIIKK
ncbi:T9SS type A sorting domain-containing protein [Chryseobacterium sp. MP_3.2]|uniref:T9SS type A sorting domain-containing protein n=1 Tax=Chryseobacterium sp. MP_3.2 TaxID=3071712 RepID=UPI002DFCE03E|nr:hypothetical protein [Chryseobacterium sp. MP_3.2]